MSTKWQLMCVCVSPSLPLQEVQQERSLQLLVEFMWALVRSDLGQHEVRDGLKSVIHRIATITCVLGQSIHLRIPPNHPNCSLLTAQPRGFLKERQTKAPTGLSQGPRILAVRNKSQHYRLGRHGMNSSRGIQ